MDLFVVSTISFRLLYGLLIMRHSRRELLWLGVTTHPNAEWIALQLTEACGWKEEPRYIIRDRDGAYGEAFIRRPRQWAYETDRSRPGRHGKTDMRRGSSARSGEIALITSLSSANSTFAICSTRIKNTITSFAHTCH